MSVGWLTCHSNVLLFLKLPLYRYFVDTYLFVSYAAFMYVLYALYAMIQSALAEANSDHAKIRC
jgi:hypothetical protein